MDGAVHGRAKEKTGASAQCVPAVTAPALHVLSLGAGVQSTTLLLMAAEGELTPRPNVAVFADTGWEPRAVYEHLDWLERTVGGTIPIMRVSRGNLRADMLREAVHGDRSEAWMPMYAVDGQEATVLRRQCTKNYKLRLIRQASRARMLAAGARAVVQWIGISLDETHRLRDSGVKYVTNRYPLIERRMTRWDCLLWMERHGYPRPPRSACLGCPFHSNDEWRAIRSNLDEWADVVAFDAAIRHLPRIRGEVYLHRSLRPLPEVDLSTPEDHGQLSFDWGNECTGMCGT